jgi:hypothetical protein
MVNEYFGGKCNEASNTLFSGSLHGLIQTTIKFLLSSPSPRFFYP